MKLLLENNVSPFDLQLTDADNLKWSVWNDNIDVGENRLVIFNTFSRNAVLMETSEIKELDEPLLNILFKLGILVESKKRKKRMGSALFKRQGGFVIYRFNDTSDAKLPDEMCLLF